MIFNTSTRFDVMELQFTTVPQGPGAQQCSYPKSPADWETHKATILRLYKFKELPEVMKEMEDQHKFKATINQYKKQFNKWKMQPKRVQTHEYRAMLKLKRSLRREANTEIVFYVHGKEVDPAKLARFEERDRERERKKDGHFNYDTLLSSSDIPDSLTYEFRPPESVPSAKVQRRVSLSAESTASSRVPEERRESRSPVSVSSEQAVEGKGLKSPSLKVLQNAGFSETSYLPTPPNPFFGDSPFFLEPTWSDNFYVCTSIEGKCDAQLASIELVDKLRLLSQSPHSISDLGKHRDALGNVSIPHFCSKCKFLADLCAIRDALLVKDYQPQLAAQMMGYSIHKALISRYCTPALTLPLGSLVGDSLAKMSRYQEAEGILETSLAGLESYYGVENLVTREAAVSLAELYMSRCEFARAEAILRRTFLDMYDHIGHYIGQVDLELPYRAFIEGYFHGKLLPGRYSRPFFECNDSSALEVYLENWWADKREINLVWSAAQVIRRIQEARLHAMPRNVDSAGNTDMFIS
ncbi:hypothetical protein BDY21DRAFT_359945 [Lineolata rhizophorae]|uniref:Clr5 domain-containing protein n=1 Tax=Lineolata rhizophorae TaxID=578093 RepID=A0A6A6PDT3_9PEZI|nr:hypothetical protein BDY21DRAFT_359945 [Lineolata rhizophorae]